MDKQYNLIQINCVLVRVLTYLPSCIDQHISRYVTENI